jgi:ABC-type uncharacterized transport system substrate-binding protein
MKGKTYACMLLLFTLTAYSLLALSCPFAGGVLPDFSQAQAAQSGTELPDHQKKRVLVLHSYHEGYQWVQDVNKGILRGLAEERFRPEKNILVKYFYMDTKRKSSSKWKQQIGRKAVATIKSWKPDVVIAADDNAQIYAVSRMVGSSYPFIFLGVNGDPRKYGLVDSLESPGHNVSGCVERERFKQSIKLLRRLDYGVDTVAVINDDGPTGRPVVERIKDKADEFDVDISGTLSTGSFRAWKRFVRAQQEESDALVVVLYNTLRDASGQHVPAKEVLNWTINNNKQPEIAFWPWIINGGVLCGEVISGYQQGHYAATLAAYVLHGQSPGQFSVGQPRRGEIRINQARAEMLGIDIPPDLKKTATMFPDIQSAQ